MLTTDMSLALANIVLGAVLPLLVALVTARVASAQVKTLVLLALSAVGGLLTQDVQAGGHLHWKVALLAAAQTYVAAVVSHYGALKPLGLTGAEGLIMSVLPKGLGAKVEKVISFIDPEPVEEEVTPVDAPAPVTPVPAPAPAPVVNVTVVPAQATPAAPVTPVDAPVQPPVDPAATAQ